MKPVALDRRQRVSRIGPRQGALQPGAFAMLLIGASYLIGQLTAGQDVKIIKDLGLAATSVFGLFIAVFIGIGLVSKEVERRSIYSLLAKPIERHQLVLGKYAGLRADAGRQPGGDGRRAVCGARLHGVGSCRPTLPGRGIAPALDPAMLRAFVLTFVELADRHRDRAVLLDVLDAAAVGGVDIRLLHRRPFQRRPAQLRSGRRLAGGGVRSPGRCTGSCRTSASFDVRAQVVHGQPVTAGYRRADDRVRTRCTSRR